MKSLAFLSLLLLFISSCKKDGYKYRVDATTSDGTNIFIQVNGTYIYSGPFVGTYEWEDTKDIDVRVKVFVALPNNGGAWPTNGSNITLKRGKKVLMETDEDILLWH